MGYLFFIILVSSLSLAISSRSILSGFGNLKMIHNLQPYMIQSLHVGRVVVVQFV